MPSDPNIAAIRAVQFRCTGHTRKVDATWIGIGDDPRVCALCGVTQADWKTMSEEKQMREMYGRPRP